jgi:TonB family protein
MTATSPRAFALSATLHAVLIALALLVGYATSQSERTAPKILELVGGEGDNYMAKEAPALGIEGGVKMSIPEPKVQPAPVQPAPPPPPEPEPEPAPVKPAPPPPQPKQELPKAKAPDATVPDFKNQIKQTVRTADKKAKREVAKERALEKKRADEEQKRLTKAEFDRLNKQKSTTTPSPKAGSTKIAKIDEGIAKGMVGGSRANKVGGAGGKALKSDNDNVLDAYYALFKQRLREKIEPPPGLSDQLMVTVEVRSLADGTLVGAKIAKSSGNREFDQAVLEAIKRVRMPERPDKRTETFEFDFTMKEKTEG